ncbi:MAG: phosphatidate cytidylyltransferase [Dehalococcoidia bacterium]|nr:phosphatidate cytidylyltransferase [Dehalococcoidia bacterium]
MSKQRVITAAVGIPVVVFAVWIGDPVFSLFIAAAALAGAFEFYHMALGPGQPLIYIGLLWTLVFVLSPHYVDVLPLVMTATIVISLIGLLFCSSREKAFHNWAWIAAGALYVGWMLSYWLNLRFLEGGMYLVFLTMFTTFANDTGAFFVGRAWGKQKLASAISPGKTWGGAVGGFLSAIAVASILFPILNLFTTLPFGYWQLLLLACIISLFAQLGDLVESLFKRNMAVKESGSLLPGHGGILDRFDSLIFVGAIVYYYVIWIIA